MRRPGLRFSDFRTLTARYDTTADRTMCGHAAHKGDLIGYARGHVVCADCMVRWTAENDEADRMEWSGVA